MELRTVKVQFCVFRTCGDMLVTKVVNMEYQILFCYEANVFSNIAIWFLLNVFATSNHNHKLEQYEVNK
jgi:hypothetical protein